jgi:peptidoglycan-N-acetylglucosamine deacetylase
MRHTLLLLLCAVLAFCPLPATAGDGPTLTLSLAEEGVTGGLPATVVLTADQPVQADTAVMFTDSNAQTYTGQIAAGQTETKVTVQTAVTDKRAKLIFTLTQAAGCPDTSSAELTLYPLPEIEFYEPIYARFVNRECQISVTMEKNNLPEDGVFTLCDQTGAVLSTLTVKRNSTHTLFHFQWTPTQAQVGRHDLSVWYRGFEVSTATGYLAMADTQALAVYGYPVTEKFIALSLDCAYEWDTIDEFLAMLDRQDVKVTFFMTGFGVEAHPEQVLKLLAHGHELANHSYSHPHMKELGELRLYRKEIRTTNRLIEELTGVRPTLFRPPYGEYDRFISAISQAEGCTVVMWTNDAKDWVDGATVRSIYKNIIRNPAPGNIILAHILNHDTVEAMDLAITYFKEMGYRLGTVSDLAAVYMKETQKDGY